MKDMNIEYVRNMQSSFMRLSFEEELDKIEEEMLNRNRIDGILELSWQREDGKYQLCYDITGKQALDAMLENQMAEERLLLNLIFGIFQVSRRIENYLLSQEGLLLLPETIYWDLKNESMCFCYYPCGQISLQEQFIHLIEYLLTKTDHKNPHAVELVYGVYEELQKPVYSMHEILERMERMRESWRLAEKEEGIAEEGSDGKLCEQLEKLPLNEKKKDETCRKNFCVEAFVEKKVEFKEKADELKKQMQAWIKPFKWKIRKQETKQEMFAFEPEEEPERQGLKTILLSEYKEEIEGVLKYEGKAALPDLQITKLPFLIGSGKGCDGILFEATISKQHAKITKVEEEYFIEDMNSSNGTRVEGELLSYKTPVRLKKNDGISFANQPYRFL